MTDVKPWRSSAAWVALVAMWICVIAQLVALASPVLLGGRLLIFAALIGLAGWVAALVAIFRSRGRVRVGAILLAVIPLWDLAVLTWSLSSTRVPTPDPTNAIITIGTLLLLVVGTLLIVIPEHLGID